MRARAGGDHMITDEFQIFLSVCVRETVGNECENSLVLRVLE